MSLSDSDIIRRDHQSEIKSLKTSTLPAVNLNCLERNSSQESVSWQRGAMAQGILHFSLFQQLGLKHWNKWQQSLSQHVWFPFPARIEAGLQISHIMRILIFVHKHSTVCVYNPNIKDQLFVKENMVMHIWQKKPVKKQRRPKRISHQKPVHFHTRAKVTTNHFN